MLMIAVMGLNHVIVNQRTERRNELEATRLRRALVAELRALHKLYLTNLDLFESKTNYVLSTRSPVIYRGNLGRFPTLFEPPLIEHLVTLFAENELLEAHLAGQAINRAGVSYQLTPQTRVEELKQMYRAGAEDLERTCEALERYGPASGEVAADHSGTSRSGARRPLCIAGQNV
jgi:hypothetical protein